DLAIEVLSPSTRAFDVVRKRADYARVGVGELWLIDPEGPAALILRPLAEATTPGEFVVVDDLDAAGELTSPQLPGLAIRVGGLLAR
ncbi:MAG: Uma2 family endonuclease, partial [Pseudonocardia sp.]